MEKILVSAIMPVYNSNIYLECDRNIGKQTYKNWKLIVNENGSRDRLIFVTNKYIKKISISS
ncbi:hypothetical protein HMPREF9520_03527 [Enterococcus faecalis TX1467]|nr:hypothetical protein HMPREF9520_03527 [Enterococcus faecalis TX1467]